MSMHKSLRLRGKHARARNVLSREERIERLEEEERWSDGDSVFGLPKVRVQTIAPRKRKEEEEEVLEEAAEAAALEEGAVTAEEEQPER